MRFFGKGSPVILLLVAILLSGCLSSSPDIPREESKWNLSPISPTVEKERTYPLSGTTWELVSYESARLAHESVIPGSSITARFEPGGILHGTSGCNQYWARYQASSARVSIETTQRTSAVCNTPAGVHSQESVYLLDLGKAYSYRVDGEILSLSDTSGRVVLIFRSGILPSADETILKKTWYLTSMSDDRGNVTPIPSGVLLTARFTEERVSGFSGCNCYFAPFDIHNASIRIGTPVKSDTWCRNETVMGQERRFHFLMREATGFVAENNSLMLMNGEREVLLLFRALPDTSLALSL